MSWTAARDVRFRRVLDEAVVIRQDAAEVLGLNGVGARVFELARGGASEDEIVQRLAEEHEIGEADVRGDVRRFLVELVEAGVLEPVEAGR